MKKFTALMLVVLLVVMAVPFSASAATTWTEVDTVAELAAIKDGNYWLTADIDLSKADWTTIAEFSGTLNGNGHTITVPTNTTFIKLLKGTVKNVNFKGAMTLDGADVGGLIPEGDVKFGGIGVVANDAYGATVENVHVNVDITYAGAGANVGGIVGNASPEYTHKADDNTITFGENCVIKNCTVAGTWNITYDGTDVKTAVGGVVASPFANTVIDTCGVTVKATVANCKGHIGGIAGSSFTDNNRPNGTPSNMDTAATPVAISNCYFGGNFNFTTVIDQATMLVGYARGLKMTNCFADGTLTVANGNPCHLFGYCNTGVSPWCGVTIEGCASVGTVKNQSGDRNVAINGKTTGIVAKNNLLVTGQTISINGKGDLNDNLNPQQAINNKVVGDAAAVVAEFVKDNASFKLVDGKVVLVQPTFTPEKDPSASTPVTPAPTGDMTIALVAVAVVALAGVTVIAKKKVTE